MQDLIKCGFCGKEYNKYGIKGHIWKKHTEEGLKHNSNIGYKTKGRKSISWSKGLTKDMNESLKKTSDTLRKGYDSGSIKPSNLGKKLNVETKKKLSDARIKYIQLNGTSKKTGGGKFGWYKDIWCDSSYELAYVIYNLEHNIYFERNKDFFKYVFGEKELIYIPDFKIGDTYIEIKGRDSFEKLDFKSKEKIKQFKGNLIVLYNGDMQVYLNYTKNKYGNNFIELYKDYIKPIKKPKVLTESQILNKQKTIESINTKVNLILNSNIDFSVFGWVRKVSDLTGITHQKVNKFMKKNMLNFYNNSCFKRKAD